MHTDDTDNADTKAHEFLYADLTYVIRGVLYSAHNELGPYGSYAIPVEQSRLI
jgi:hypothetical protein